MRSLLELNHCSFKPNIYWEKAKLNLLNSTKATELSPTRTLFS